MAHFMTLIDNKCLGAVCFTDSEMRPKPRDLTIKRVAKGKPPGGGKERWEFWFVETDKSAFFSTGQIKKLANMLMCADTDGWTGVKITVTCAPVKSPKGGETMGMIITKAIRQPRQEQTGGREQSRTNEAPTGQDDRGSDA